MTQPQYYIGLMSGTSLDAIDAALVQLDNKHIQLISTHSESIPSSIKRDILDLCTPGFNAINRMGIMDTKLGRLFVDATLNLLKKANIKSSSITAIGSHGQTIRHSPSGDFPFTIQIGDPHIIAAHTGINTVADFRRKDLAHQGQGAPLAPLFHKFLLQEYTDHQWMLNIGGIANLTLLPADGNIIGFDTGPGNMLLDLWCKQHTQKEYDDNGKWGSSGKYNSDLLIQFLKDPYFSQPSPKSTGREYFNNQWLNNYLKHFPNIAPEDVQATLVELTAQSIADAIHIKQPQPSTIWLAGGGSHNNFLISRLQQACRNHKIKSTSALGIPPDWIEACAFGWLAKQTLDHQISPLSQITGACRNDILGAIHPATPRGHQENKQKTPT